MSEVSDAGSAPAPSEAPSAAPIENGAPTPSQPLGTQTPVAEKASEPEKPAAPEKAEKADKKPEPSKSAGEAIRKANEQIKAREAAKAEAAKAEAAKPAENKPADAKAPKDESKAETEARQRDQSGKFAAKEASTPADPAKDGQRAPEASSEADKASTPHREAPSRFSPDAKSAWETAPEPIKAEVHRAIRELEQGHQKYKADAERYESVREYDELARQNGREGVHESLKQMVDIEKSFQRDPIEGFQKIADHFGIPLRAVAAHIMGQKPEEVQAQTDQTVRTLKSEIAELKQQLGSVTQTIQQQRETDVMGKVQAFAKDHPRFDELSSDIAFFLTSGRTSELSEAYELAERLNPAPAKASPAPADPAPAPAAPLNPAGQKSISGAPTPGSNPASKAPKSKTTREALARAFAQAG